MAQSDAFLALVAPHLDGLRRFTRLMVGREAEDVVQETLAAALRQLETFEKRSAFSTWLFGIARNLCCKHLRDRARRAAGAPTSVLDARPAPRHGVLTSVVRRELAERMEHTVQRLPLTLREAFLLRSVEGLSFSEVAAILGVSEATARVRAFRARALLRTELGPVVDTVWLENV